ncbi:Crp/Fnr family transcriptional regulator [Parapedobacter koreensis]|uniref:CRP/FNR family transcriptional regulator, anaerobic regulatory protein n=1 Tax=Parapedobacter koreensis TaxID=332977 RepID=A0A1H7M7Q3_9SPHI|nr:Crp/Fnr family transcriptional regulator [Parapedobacter koreensis]SEL06958.1 CRP/FNR family transcriptional regulator, anaerobic regulatory protein [Parapedobacter koreensis]
MNTPSLQAAIQDYLTTYFSSFERELKDILAEQCSIKHFAAGEQLMQTGQYFKSTMLIVKGLVKVYREGGDGGEFFVYHLEPGSACALSMICATKQEKSEILATAVEETTALLIPIAMMDDLMRKYKTWYYFVLETYRSRFEELLEVIDHVAFRGMDERLDYYLQKLSKQQDSKLIITTHQQIANDLGSSREVISRLLKKMEQHGKVVLGRNTIQLFT